MEKTKERTALGQDYKSALEDGRIIIVGVKYTRNGWTAFKVYENTGGHLTQIVVPESSYWRESNGTYSCIAWGTDRRLEIILSIGYALGLTFNDMRQNYQWLQDTY